MKIRCWLVSLAFVLLACNLGPLLLEATPTAPATATPIPTLAPTSTETPTAAPTAYFIPTQVPAPTAITCPKGTELRPSVNRCFYVTRTPKPENRYCPQFTHKWSCINNGCSWDAKAGVCSK